ncbi:MAG: hypothetical protein M3450_10675 [Actinomycetota bacterium]|nr:hypothetical protein [Actinomycetota bacterium]
MLEAERQFRRIVGYKDLAKLSVAIERDLDHHRQPPAPPAKEEAFTPECDKSTVDRRLEVLRRAGHPPPPRAPKRSQGPTHQGSTLVSSLPAVCWL